MQRSPDPEAEENEHKEWAKAAAESVQAVQRELVAANGRLSADGSAAVAALEALQESYDDFENKYSQAVENFKTGVKLAQEETKAFREHFEFVAENVLGGAVPKLMEARGKATGKLKTIESVAKLATAGGIIQKDDSGPGGESDKAPGASEKIDWSQLVTTALDTFKATLVNDEHLDKVSEVCTEHMELILKVLTGEEENPYSSDAGLEAVDMVDNAPDIIATLQHIGEGDVSEPVKDFKAQAEDRMGEVSVAKLEQDIAIKWISGLSQSQLDEIHTSETYLKSIGLINAQGNRLGYHTGWITTEHDEAIIQMLAQVENVAMGLVGQTAEWLGGHGHAYGVSGQIRDDRGRTWPAAAPAGTSEEGGGLVRITSYKIMERDTSGFENARPSNLREILFSDVGFSVVPLGKTGGGAPSTAGPYVTNP